MHTPLGGSIKVELKLTDTNSPKRGSIFVVGEMSNVHNLVDYGSESRDEGRSRSARKRKAWCMVAREKGRGENPSKVDLVYLETDLLNVARRNLLPTLTLTICHFLRNQASVEVTSHSRHGEF